MRMYLDDIREPKNDFDVIVRSYDEAVAFINKNGIPNFISFDHDLGVDENENLLPTGYDFAKWLVDMDMDNIYKFPENFTFHVHSANPVGKANIEGYLNNYLKSR